MKQSNTLRKIWSLILTLAMVLTMGITALPSYAAGNGTASVSYKPAKDGKVEETFTLYKVGHFERYKDGDVIPEGSKVGDSYLALDEGLPDVNINIKKSDYPDDDAWIAAWQTAAASVASGIEGTPAEATAVTAIANAANGGVAVFSGLEDGLYLVTGPMQEYQDKDKGENTYYTPNPSFIMVLNVTAELEAKYEERTVKEYHIKKAWVDEGHEALRPTSIDVELYRRDSSVEGSEYELIETITLNESNRWSYKWDSEPKYEWKWKEIMDDETAIHYIVSETSRMGQAVNAQNQEVNDDNVKYVTLTNTYTKRKLSITKILDKFLENGDNSATFVFEIRGFMGEGDKERQVYTASAGINFAKDATGSLTTIVDNIPVNLTRLEVEEVYASNYQAVDGKIKDNGKIGGVTLNLDEGMYYVSFENDYNDEITIKGGIVNKYTNKEGKVVLTDKDYGKTPVPAQ